MVNSQRPRVGGGPAHEPAGGGNTSRAGRKNPATRAMLDAASRLTAPHLEIKPVLAADSNLPCLAHVCLDTLCLPPVSDPEQLADAVANMSTGSPFGASPFGNIFERFPG